MEVSTALSILTLFFGAGATISALGGLAVREGGRFYQLTLRGAVSISMLLVATVCGATKEWIDAREARRLQATLAAESQRLVTALADNAELTRKMNAFLTARKVELVPDQQDGRILIRNTGVGEVTRVVLEEHLRWSGSVALFHKGTVRADWDFYDIELRASEFRPAIQTGSDPVFVFRLSDWEKGEAKLKNELDDMAEVRYPDLPKGRALSFSVNLSYCALVVAEDQSGGRYTLPIVVDAFRPGGNLASATSFDAWTDCITPKPYTLMYEDWGRTIFDNSFAAEKILELADDLVANARQSGE